MELKAVAQTSELYFINHLFIVTAATSTMGLATASVVDNYTLFGQQVVIVLIQVGGIGYMSFASFIIIGGKRLSQLSASLRKTGFSISETYPLTDFIEIVTWFSLLTRLARATAYRILREYSRIYFLLGYFQKCWVYQ